MSILKGSLYEGGGTSSGGGGVTTAQVQAISAIEDAKSRKPLAVADGGTLSADAKEVNVINDGATVNLPTATPADVKYLLIEYGDNETFEAGGVTYLNESGSTDRFYIKWDGTTQEAIDRAPAPGSAVDTSALHEVYNAANRATYPINKVVSFGSGLYRTKQAAPTIDPVDGAQYELLNKPGAGLEYFTLTAGDSTLKHGLEGEYINYVTAAGITPVFPAIQATGTLIALQNTVDVTFNGKTYPPSTPLGDSWFWESDGTNWVEVEQTASIGQLILPTKAELDKYTILKEHSDGKSLDPSGGSNRGRFTLKDLGSGKEWVKEGEL